MALEVRKNMVQRAGRHLLALGFLLFCLNPGCEAAAAELALDQTLEQAHSGDMASSYFLGVMYRTGSGVEKDCAKALEWTRRAARAGHALAQSHLGVLYREGCGAAVPKNPVAALVWSTLAAEQGLVFAGENREALRGELHPYLLAEAQRRVDELRVVSD